MAARGATAASPQLWPACVHRLQEHQISNSDYTCDECDRPLQPGEPAYGCRECDYDQCAECYKTREHPDNRRKVSESAVIPLPEDLAKMSKEELLAMFERVRATGCEPQPLPEAPQLERATSGEERVTFGSLQGEWEDDDRAIRIGGDAKAPVVRFTRSRYRNVRQLTCSNYSYDVTRDGGDVTVGLKFTVSFPADESNASGAAEWTIYSSGRLRLIINGEADEDRMRRPMPYKPARASMTFAAKRMTEPCSKALGLFDGLPPFAIWDENEKPLYLPVLHKEAELRLQDGYILEAAAFFDKGLVPPMALDEAAELQALEAHGKDASWIEAYRFGARMVPREQREDVFFLRANDRLFRPRVELQSRSLEGTLVDHTLRAVSCRELLAAPRTLLVASTAS